MRRRPHLLPLGRPRARYSFGHRSDQSTAAVSKAISDVAASNSLTWQWQSCNADNCGSAAPDRR
jgi:hypothetical protein